MTHVRGRRAFVVPSNTNQEYWKVVWHDTYLESVRAQARHQMSKGEGVGVDTRGARYLVPTWAG